ncbi:MAG: hypothetical protein QNJ32_16185 [Xenococcaceae cyanobacterium MO_167.B27]|nr:hypothetical protein [Xenococcaceae cyanobacterium MO_167.B27]
MAASASLTLVNKTGSPIKITKVKSINNDSTFVGINVNDVIENEYQQTQVIGNSSVVIASQGCGAYIGFVCESNFELGEVYLNIPAVGAHSFQYGNKEVFVYKTENTSENNYIVTISLSPE